jgi:transposase-like protein
MTEKEDLAMKNQRSFGLEFKRQVVEELLSGESSAAQLCRRRNIGATAKFEFSAAACWSIAKTRE